jgi:hypothetical protein
VEEIKYQKVDSKMTKQNAKMGGEIWDLLLTTGGFGKSCRSSLFD